MATQNHAETNCSPWPGQCSLMTPVVADRRVCLQALDVTGCCACQGGGDSSRSDSTKRASGTAGMNVPRLNVVASGVEEGDEHGQDPLGTAGHVHVGRAGEHGQLSVWHQVDRL